MRSLCKAEEARRAGQWREAVVAYREVLAANPAQRNAANNLAWILATCLDGSVRDGAEAVRLMEWAKNGAVIWQHAGTLAAACAEVGDFAAAIEWGQKAQRMAGGGDDGRWERWLKGFAEGKAVRESAEGAGDANTGKAT